MKKLKESRYDFMLESRSEDMRLVHLFVNRRPFVSSLLFLLVGGLFCGVGYSLMSGAYPNVSAGATFFMSMSVLAVGIFCGLMGLLILLFSLLGNFIKFIFPPRHNTCASCYFFNQRTAEHGYCLTSPRHRSVTIKTPACQHYVEEKR